MTTQTTSALDQFIADMTELVRGQPEQSELFQRAATYLERLIGEPDAIPEQFPSTDWFGIAPQSRFPMRCIVARVCSSARSSGALVIGSVHTTTRPGA